MKTFFYCVDLNGWLKNGFLKINAEFCEKHFEMFLTALALQEECPKDLISIINIFKV